MSPKRPQTIHYRGEREFMISGVTIKRPAQIPAENPTGKNMLSLTTFADELERDKARQRTYDAMLRKAKAGHVTGGACFGYRNVEIRGAYGTRSHVMREIEPTEANVIRRIFELSAAGYGVRQSPSYLTPRGHRRQGAAGRSRRGAVVCPCGPVPPRLSRRQLGHSSSVEARRRIGRAENERRRA